MNIENIKTKLLVKYPLFGGIIVETNFVEKNSIQTIGTDGKNVYYNTNFMKTLNEEEKVFIFAHVTCHIAFDHIKRSKGRDQKLWDIATDAVINAFLKQDNLPLIKGEVDIPEAINYNAEEMYEKLLEKQQQEKEHSRKNENNPNRTSDQNRNQNPNDNKNQNPMKNKSMEKEEQKSQQKSQDNSNDADNKEEKEQQSENKQSRNQENSEQNTGNDTQNTSTKNSQDNSNNNNDTKDQQSENTQSRNQENGEQNKGNDTKNNSSQNNQDTSSNANDQDIKQQQSESSQSKEQENNEQKTRNDTQNNSTKTNQNSSSNNSDQDIDEQQSEKTQSKGQGNSDQNTGNNPQNNSTNNNQELNNKEQNSTMENTSENQTTGNDTHTMWQQTIRQEEANNKSPNNQNRTSDKNQSNKEIQNKKEIQQLSFSNEKEAFEKNKKERKQQLENVKKSLIMQSIGYGNDTDEELRKVRNIGTSKPILDWKLLLEENIRYDEDWTYQNAEIEYGVLTPVLEEIPNPETEIILDTSGSVDEELLKNFLKECKNILHSSKIKIGCFDTQFYGFTEINSIEDIENLELFGGGGTDFNVAINSFSRWADNKIIFTDGLAPEPRSGISAIWIIYSDIDLKPKNGTVIHIPEEQLKNLYNYSKVKKIR